MTSTSDRSSTPPERVVEEVYRAEWGRLLALLIARTRRLDLAEDALGEAFARASHHWSADGVPGNPAGWLYTTAHRQVLGRIRAEATAGRRTPLLAVRRDADITGGVGGAGDLDERLPDERLHLIVLCCHPALAEEARPALALRLVIGTPTDQIARLFLVPVPTMAARLTRAKRKIVLAGIPLRAPPGDELQARLDGICRTIYLAFTAGYTPHDGPELMRPDLAGEAVRLGVILHQLAPAATQVSALLALMLLQHSRRDSRTDRGRLVTLAEQDRSSWHHDEIAAGLRLVDALPPTVGYAEELRLQAVIAAEHARAPTAETTDWQAIADRYAELEALTGSAVVRLNRAVATAEAIGADAGLALLVGLDELLPGNHRVAAVRGELAARAGAIELAETSLRDALALCANEVEREHLAARLVALRAADG